LQRSIRPQVNTKGVFLYANREPVLCWRSRVFVCLVVEQATVPVLLWAIVARLASQPDEINRELT